MSKVHTSSWMDTAEEFAPHVARATDWVVKNMGPGGRGQWKGSKGFYSGQRQAQLAASGAQGAKSRKQSAMQIEMRMGKRGRSPAVSTTSISNDGKRVMRDTTAHERPMIGSELIPSLATNRLPAVSLKLGKRLTNVDSITPFLKNLSQSGKMACQYGGRFKSSTKNQAANPLNFQGERMVVSQNFRHCWSSKNFLVPTVTPPTDPDPGINSDGYPVVPGNTTLGPTCVVSTELPPGGTVQATLSSPYYLHSNGENNFSMINRPDCEDMMWNMNKLKLVHNASVFQDNVTNEGQQVGGVAFPTTITNNPMFYQNVAAYQPNRHFRFSAIMDNNEDGAYEAGDPNEKEWLESPYKYNAVFKHGTVKYDFKNCEMTGARVEIIVYKQKKNRVSSDSTVDFSSDTDYIYGRPLDNIAPPIGQGYIDTVYDKLGTEDMGGRLPNAADIYTNPMYPLLPELKKTLQANLRFKEISRTAFCLTSGAQRTLEIVLPGDEYDPANISKFQRLAGGTVPGPGKGGYAIMDDHTYTIVIAVCGVKMTRMVSTVQTDEHQPTDTVAGEIHSPFNVEYLCTYTEHMGACKYKNPKPVNVFNNALVCDTNVVPGDVDNKVPVTAVTIIPLENTVRNTNKILNPPAIAGGVSMEVDTGFASGNPIPH